MFNFDIAYCSNNQCDKHRKGFLYVKYSRCPVCREPALLPSENILQINRVNNDIFSSYFDSNIWKPLKDYKNEMHAVASTIGHTPLLTRNTIADWAGLPYLQFKNEMKNPTGSFKERGSFTALLLHLLSTLEHDENSLILGTVSTGNMAISTVWMVHQFAKLLKKKRIHLKSFVVVHKDTSSSKIQMIQNAAGVQGTSLFIVDGEYSNFHEHVYSACSILREKGIFAYAELTDDMYRLLGYATLFVELVEQMYKVPDVILVPVASGGLFRVGVWAYEQLYKKGLISKIPRIILVQEEGADPIVQAFTTHKRKIEKIKIDPTCIAEAIDVSSSRSGNPTLDILKNKYHKAISVDKNEIKEAKELLWREELYVEEAGAASVAAAKKLKKNGILSGNESVIALLSGESPSKRALFTQKFTTSKIIQCNESELSQKLVRHFIS